MSEPMRRQILDQPATLRSLLARQDEIARALAATADGAQRIWAVGHGDSYFAPLAAATAFRRWSPLPYAALLAQEMAAYMPAEVDDHALVIVLSMSGGVGRSIAAAEAACARRARVLAVTNTPGSPLTTVADETILLNIVEPAPFLAGTETYTACVLALLMIALQVGRRSGEVPALEAAIDSLQAALSSEAAVSAWVKPFAVAPVWYLLGMDCQTATAHYGAAKLAEVADAVGIAHDTEEFFHEHHWVARDTDPVVLLTHDPASQARSQSAAAHLRELGVPVCLVGPGPSPVGVFHVDMAPVEPWCAPLPAVVPLQWLAYWLSRARGLNPDRRDHLRDSPRYVVSRKYR